MTSVIFYKKIQKGNRIAIPPEIMNVLELEIGELVELEVKKVK